MTYNDKRILMVEDRYGDCETDVTGPYANFAEAKKAALEILDRLTYSDLKGKRGGRQIVVCEYFPDDPCSINEIVDVVEESGRIDGWERRMERRSRAEVDDEEDEEE